jgi:hypothetical protein
MTISPTRKALMTRCNEVIIIIIIIITLILGALA